MLLEPPEWGSMIVVTKTSDEMSQRRYIYLYVVWSYGSTRYELCRNTQKFEISLERQQTTRSIFPVLKQPPNKFETLGRSGYGSTTGSVFLSYARYVFDGPSSYKSAVRNRARNKHII